MEFREIRAHLTMFFLTKMTRRKDENMFLIESVSLENYRNVAKRLEYLFRDENIVEDEQDFLLSLSILSIKSMFA